MVVIAARTMSVYQIVYISAATIPFSDDDLKELLVVSRANNSSLGVSGMLVFHKGSFIQVLEGEHSAVESVLEKIEKDDRHSKVVVLLKGETAERTFESWAMGFLPSESLSDIPEGFHPFLKSGFQKTGDTEDAARNALLAFKEGRWRAKL